MDTFNAVYKEFSPMIYQKALRMLGKSEDAMDVLQEVAMKLHLNYAAFQAHDYKVAWVYRVTTNVCLNMIRSKKYRKTEDDSVLMQMPSSSNIESEVAKADQIRELIQKLPMKLHPIFIYYYIDGMTQEEIADVTDSARITVARALKKISGILKIKETEE